MANPFEAITQRMAELGFFDFLLPFLITSAVIWGLLERSRIFEGKIAVNAVISLSFSFLIWGYLSSASAMKIGLPFSTFVTQVSIMSFVFLLSLVVISMFYPDFTAQLGESLGRGATMIGIGIGIAVFLFFSSGLAQILGIGGLVAKGDVGIVILMLAVFIIMLFIISGIAGPGGGVIPGG